MKKTLAASLIATVALTGAACSGSSETDNGDNATSTTQEKEEERVDAMPWLHDQFGAEPSEVLAQDPAMWYGYVSDAYIDHGNLHVLLQVDRKADKALAERAQDALVNFVKIGSDPRVDGVSYVVVEDGAGVVITQKMVR